jgi:hypothetical protein
MRDRGPAVGAGPLDLHDARQLPQKGLRREVKVADVAGGLRAVGGDRRSGVAPLPFEVAS